jgi:hypothetical protein
MDHGSGNEYTIVFGDESKRYYAYSADQGGLNCTFKEYANKAAAPVREHVDWSRFTQYPSIEIRNYRKNFDIVFTGVYHYAVFGMTRIAFLAKSARWFIQSYFPQLVFNQFGFGRPERFRILQFLLNRYLRTGVKEVSAMDLLKEMHTEKIYLHPKFEVQIDLVEYVLAAWVDTGEVELIGDDYRLTPKAAVMLEAYRLEERRHADMLRIQIILAVLSACLVLLTAATLLDKT